MSKDFDISYLNRPLLRDRTHMLKEGLVEHFDYEVVTHEVWNHLYSWYSADYCVYRAIKKDKFNNYKIYLDLYPGISFY